MKKFSHFVCPKCGKRLIRSGRIWRCRCGFNRVEEWSNFEKRIVFSGYGRF